MILDPRLARWLEELVATPGLTGVGYPETVAVLEGRETTGVCQADSNRFGCYTTIENGKAEFVNGTRLVYPMENEAMRPLNFIANSRYGRLTGLQTKFCNSAGSSKKSRTDFCWTIHEPMGPVWSKSISTWPPSKAVRPSNSGNGMGRSPNS